MAQFFIMLLANVKHCGKMLISDMLLNGASQHQPNQGGAVG
jgi:hypothetical protein